MTEHTDTQSLLTKTGAALRLGLIGVGVLACVAAGLLFLAGRLAHLHPALDLINNFLPFIGLGCLGLLLLAIVLRSWVLTGLSGALTIVFASVFLTLPGAARSAPDGTPSTLRVVTFNLEYGNANLEKITRFLVGTNADVVLLQEFHTAHRTLPLKLERHYPYRAGARELVILSKHVIVTTGSINREGSRNLLVRWAHLLVEGKSVEVASVHMSLPFDARRQQTDLADLTAYVKSRIGPLIIGGDFSATPWTYGLRRFTDASGLRRFNTLHPSWPGHPDGRPPWPNLPVRFPVLPIDNVFVSEHFAKVATETGPWIGSDHRPVMADIAPIE